MKEEQEERDEGGALVVEREVTVGTISSRAPAGGPKRRELDSSPAIQEEAERLSVPFAAGSRSAQQGATVPVGGVQ